MSDTVRPNILFSDESLLAISKPPGIAVHESPGQGHSLLRDLRLEHGASLTPAHRLDKDASGVLLLARSKAIAARLQRSWHLARKVYWALCDGIPGQSQGVINELILENRTSKPERMENALRYFRKTHPDRQLPPAPAAKTSAVHPAGRSSQTNYGIIETFGDRWCWLEVRPQQGRMHQIRVHLAYAGHPLAVDPLYGRRNLLCASDIGAMGAEVLTRMPLHAAKLTFIYPSNPEREISIDAPLPDDLKNVLTILRISGLTYTQRG